MKILLTSICLLIATYSNAQDSYPGILNFEVCNNNDENNASRYYLMLSPQRAIDLKSFGNKECEYKMIACNTKRVILEYIQPSKLSPKGMCASGEEKGFLLLELDDDNNLINSKSFLTESCLLLIECTETKAYSGILEYTCGSLHTSESYLIRIDTDNVLIKKTVK